MEGVCVTGDANTCARNIADKVKEAFDARPGEQGLFTLV